MRMRMDKEPWVYKGKINGKYDAASKAVQEALPKIRENYDKMMNEKIPDEFKKMFK